jgi:hypothetical protein
MMIHEISGHLWAQAAGMPFKLKPNEKLASYIEAQVMYDVYAGHPPAPVTYKTP